MSQSQLVDGRTGDPIGERIYGGDRGYNQERTYVTTTNSAYVPAQTYGVGSGYREERVQGGYREERVGGGYREERVGASNAQIVGTTVNTGKDVIKGESRIEYVPFEKKILEYKDQAKVERVPKKVKRVEYREERKVETIPREVTVTDYYAVEYLRQYIPQYVPEKRIEYVQVPKKQIRYEYIPVERQIVHYPDQALEERTETRVETRVEGGYPAEYRAGEYRTVGGGEYRTEYNTTYERPVTYTTGQREVVYSTGPQGTYEVPASGYTEQRYYSTTGNGGYRTGEVTNTTAEYAVNRG